MPLRGVPPAGRTSGWAGPSPVSSIVFLSHTARASDFRVGSHHLSRALAATGHEVAHISTPFSIVHAVLKPGQEARRKAAFSGPVTVDGVDDLIPTPCLPANIRWSRRQTDRALRSVGIARPDFVFIDQPLFPSRHFPSSTVIFRPTDIFPTKALNRAARRTAAEADGVAATSPKVLESVIAESDRPRAVLENGVEYGRFAAAAGTEKQYDFVYVGALDFRFDFSSLASAALAFPNSVFAIFGPLPSNLPTFPPNVEFRGAIPYASVPDAIARGRVGIMPFVENPSNAARSPMKLYEYVAAGVPVVAPSSIADRARGVAALVPFTPDDPLSFAQALGSSLTHPAPNESDKQSARDKDWSSVAAALLDFAVSVKRGSTR